jgi:hypothetical protein
MSLWSTLTLLLDLRHVRDIVILASTRGWYCYSRKYRSLVKVSLTTYDACILRLGIVWNVVLGEYRVSVVSMRAGTT